MTKQECLKLPKSCLECIYKAAKLLEYPCNFCSKYNHWEFNKELESERIYTKN